MMRNLHKSTLRALAFAALAVVAATAVAQPPPTAAGNPPGTHTLNLKDADIQALIATVSEITGRNFIVGPNVQGKVSVISARPMQPDEIYDVFLSVLRVHGYAAVPAGSMIKIVPEAMAQAEGGNSVATAESGDAIVTQIVPLRHVAAAELVPILRPLVPQGAQLAAHQTSNSLVISDRASNVQRIAGIIARIDTVSDAEVEVIPLQHANASEMARTLTLLADDKGAQATGEAPRVLADERTNSILIAGAKSGRLRMRTLVTHLDTPLNKDGGTNVIYLRYAKAKDLVPILTGVAATLNNEAPPTAPKAGETAAAGAGGGNATIQAHEETNALIVSASPAVYRALEGVIRQLDVRRAQVLIEAIIAEVSDEAAREIGVQWFGAPKDGKGVIGGSMFSGPGGQPNLLGLATSTAAGRGSGLALGNGLSLGYLDGTVNIGGQTILNLGVLVRALQGDGRANVLSTPSVLTLDNQEAIIKVAQEVPFKTGQYTNATGSTGGTNSTLTPFQTIERKDVGLTLKVTPHVNEGDSVRLDLHQEVSSLAPSVDGAVDLITNKRELSTSVLVADDSTLVLGGLIENSAKDNNQKVPGLGSIPVLGNLFRYRNNNVTKRDLMVFLHPKILRDAATEQAVSSEKYNYIRTEQMTMRANRENLTPGSKQPALPQMHDFLANPVEPEAEAKPAPGTKPARGKK